MQPGVVLLVLMFILTATAWFDDAFVMLQIKKSYALMLMLSLLVLNTFCFSPTPELEINPAILLMTTAGIWFSICNGKVSIVLALSVTTLICAIGLMAIYLCDISPAAFAAVSGAILGIVFSTNSAYIILCTSAFPLMLYLLAVGLELIYFSPAIAVADMFDAQIAGMGSGLLVAVCTSALQSKAKNKRNGGENYAN